MKGITEIELTDVRTGKVEKYTETNLVTNAIADFFSHNIDGMLFTINGNTSDLYGCSDDYYNSGRNYLANIGDLIVGCDFLINTEDRVFKKANCTPWTYTSTPLFQYGPYLFSFGGYYANSTSQKDNCFEQNYKNAKAAGLDVGAYWYSYADSAEDAVREARACMEVIKGKKFEYPIYFDLEEQSQFAKGKNFCDSVIKAFCGELEKNGYLPGLYCSTYYLNNFVSNNVASKYPLWVAQYNYRCTYTANKYGIWQHSSEGRVNGISDNVDMDYCYVDYPTIVKNGGYNGYKKPLTVEKKTVTQLAKEVIEGKWSNGDERKQKLTEAGYNYSAVQKKVNELCEKMKIDEIANEVIQGKWGNGEERQQKLTDAGYNYDKVQARVNELMK